MLESNQKITVGKAKEYESIIRNAYEIAYGEIFKHDDNVNYQAEEYVEGYGDEESHGRAHK